MARIADASISFFWSPERKAWDISWRAEGKGGIVRVHSSAPIDAVMCEMLARHIRREMESLLPF